MEEVIQLDTCGLSFIILRKEVVSIIENQTINHLPLSEKCIAGISQIEGCVLTFLDFSECIGLKHVTGKTESHILKLSEDDIAGFSLSGDINTFSISEKDIFNVHPYIKNEIISKVAIKNQLPVPVININNLFNYIKQNYIPFMFTPVLEYNSNQDINKTGYYYIVNSGEETFAIPSRESGNEPVKTANVVPLPILPSFIKGISFYHNNLIPVIDPGIKMGIKNESASDMLLPIDINGITGFVIDSIEYDHTIKSDNILLLPPLVQTKWMHSGIIYNNKIYPVVEPDYLLASASGGSDEILLHERYNPDSQFPHVKQKEIIRVTEILFSEAVHAVPEMEIEDIVQYKLYFKIPNTKSIIAGITEHENEILPVIDPAVCYGLRSSPAESWKMILIKNGDFRCFVLTEQAYNAKEIQIKDQLEFPVKLDHEIIYVCYPENDRIRFVLNIEALAVYFEDSMASDISEIFLSGKQKIITTGLVPENETIIAAETTDNTDEFAEVKSILPGSREDNIPEVFKIEETEANEDEQLENTGTETDEQLKNTETETDGPVAEEPEEPEEAEEAEEAPEAYAFEEEVFFEKEAFFEKEDFFEKNADTEEAGQKEIPVTEENEFPEKESLETENIESEMNKNEEEDIEKETETEPVQEETFKTVTSRSTEEDTEFVPAEEEEKPELPESEFDNNNEQDKFSNVTVSAGKFKGYFKYHKKFKLIIAIVFILIIVFALLFVIYKSGSKFYMESRNNSGPDKTEELLNTEGKTEKDKQNVLHTEKDNVSTEYFYEIYNVKKGDTLYEITESFTGNGFDYPEVARDNKIQNPDLIFPRQIIKIKIRKDKF